jgi:N utilization substance protein B
MPEPSGLNYRRHSREIALQVLYSLAQGNSSYADTFDLFSHEAPMVQDYALTLIRGVQAHEGDIVDLLASRAQHWDLDRIAVVDRVIMSIAVYEMKYGTPPIKPAIAVNEAVEVAKRFGGQESHKFVNGVLRAIGDGGAQGREDADS